MSKALNLLLQAFHTDINTVFKAIAKHTLILFVQNTCLVLHHAMCHKSDSLGLKAKLNRDIKSLQNWFR